MSPRVILPAEAPADEWHRVRQGGIGGSDVAAAAGLNPFKTPYALWLDKTGRVEFPEHDERAAERMHWGNVLEPVLLREFDERHDDVILTGGDGVYAHPDRDWQLGNVDGLAWTPDQQLDGIVECKTGGHSQLAKWADGGVPAHYVAQVQWYMSIMDAPRTYVVALLDTSTYVERVIERDDELVTDLVDAGAEFWAHVLRDEPPPVDGTDATRRALARWGAVPGESIELDPSWNKDIARRRELSDMMTALDAERTAIDNRLRAAMGSAETATVDGERVATNRQPSKPSRSVDYAGLAERYPDAYDECVTERPASRRLTLNRNEKGTGATMNQ